MLRKSTSIRRVILMLDNLVQVLGYQYTPITYKNKNNNFENTA